MKYTNALIHESSPYLLQHAHNPVNWIAYGTKAFETAKVLDKPILFSIGYSSCHWCHVMEKESFENEDIARIMNDYFVCVKVDREERPDVDHVYMDAVQLLNGNAGWPLNCFALPDGRPFWGGTYFRPDQWAYILTQIHDLYQNQRDKITEQADDLTNHVKSFQLAIDYTHEQQKANFDTIFEILKNNFDEENGGMYGTPKFPMPVVFEFLFLYGQLKNEDIALQMVETTLFNMAKGGIYDQVGGGFARYATDKIWKVPHFEKMLYDNAQLVSLYAKAYKNNPHLFYGQIIEETLAFISREMTAPQGFFYAALDADSEGEEGLFYTYTQQDFTDTLGEYATLIASYYQLQDKGLWENGRSILMAYHDDSAFAQQHCLSENELHALLKFSKKELLKLRDKRVKPELDDKMLLSWNSLMCMAYIDAYMALQHDAYLESALKCIDFIMGNLKDKNGGYFHTYKNGKATINAFLDDYAFFIQALLVAYTFTTDEKYLYEAESLSNYVLHNFQDKHSGFFFFSPHQNKDIFANKIETYDGVIPSGNATMANILYKLGIMLDNSLFLETSRQMILKMLPLAEQHPAAYAAWAKQALLSEKEPVVIAVVGKNAKSMILKVAERHKESFIICGSEADSPLPYIKNRYKENQTLFYICKGAYCLEPFNSPDNVLLQLQNL